MPLASAVCICYRCCKRQDTSIEPVRPKKPAIVRPYFAPRAPPVRLNNSARLNDLIRAGVLYLTAQDAIALALENNIDLEVGALQPADRGVESERGPKPEALCRACPAPRRKPDRSPTARAWRAARRRRASEAGAAAGGGGNGGNATISQIGPIAQTFDPSIQESSVFSHITTPEPNATQSITSVLVDTTHVHNLSLQEGFLTGGSATISYSDHYLKENAATDIFNPTSAPNLGISVQQNLLRGFGIGVNQRTINVNKINLQISDLGFKSQVINTVASVLIQYYGLAADYEDLRAKQSALDTAQRFFENTEKAGGTGSAFAIGRDHGAVADGLQPERSGGVGDRAAPGRTATEERVEPHWRDGSGAGCGADRDAGPDHGAGHGRSGPAG